MLVATASLELGIDIGDVDLVSSAQLPTFDQCVPAASRPIGSRGGRHAEGRLFPLSRDDLVESAALLDSVRRGELDRLDVPQNPLDVLAQQIAAEVAARKSGAKTSCSRAASGAYPYRVRSSARNSTKIVQMIAEGFSTRRGRTGCAHPSRLR